MPPSLCWKEFNTKPQHASITIDSVPYPHKTPVTIYQDCDGPYTFGFYKQGYHPYLRDFHFYAGVPERWTITLIPISSFPPEPDLPPPPPSPAPGKYWLILAMETRWVDSTLEISLQTDVPCHLWLHRNQEGIIVHPRMMIRRGAPTWRNPHLGFNIESSIEQKEPGDTLEHSFSLDFPYICKTWYYYFKGTINGNTSPSRSPFFNDHYEGLQTMSCFTEDWSPEAPPPFPDCILEDWGPSPPPPFPNCIVERWWS